MNNMQKAFFFDRDGVINADHGYVSRAEDIEFLPGIFPVMRELQSRGYVLIVVTNQSGIGRGYYTEDAFLLLTGWMINQFAAEGINIQGFYHCPHAPEDQCSCRKPEPGLFLRAIQDHDVDTETSWMVGDKESDMCAAEKAGIRNRVLLGGKASEHSTCAISDIRELLELSV